MRLNGLTYIYWTFSESFFGQRTVPPGPLTDTTDRPDVLNARAGLLFHPVYRDSSVSEAKQIGVTE